MTLCEYSRSHGVAWRRHLAPRRIGVLSSSTHVGLLDTSRTTTQTERRSITRMHDRSPRGVSNVGNGPLARHIIVSDGLKPNTLMLVAATEKVWPLEFLLASTCALMTSSHLPSTAARMRTRHATCPHESSGADAIVSEWNQHAFHLARVASGPITGLGNATRIVEENGKRLCPKRATECHCAPVGTSPLLALPPRGSRPSLCERGVSSTFGDRSSLPQTPTDHTKRPPTS